MTVPRFISQAVGVIASDEQVSICSDDIQPSSFTNTQPQHKICTVEKQGSQNINIHILDYEKGLSKTASIFF